MRILTKRELDFLNRFMVPLDRRSVKDFCIYMSSPEYTDKNFVTNSTISMLAGILEKIDEVNNNKEEIKAYGKAYYEANKEKKKAVTKAYYKANKEKVKVYKKVYHEVNKESKFAYCKAYKEANKEKVMVYMKAYHKNRCAKDPLFKLSKNIRQSTCGAFKRGGWKKNSKTQELLGCDFSFLQAHLIASALRNYGHWFPWDKYEIDHIIPVSSAKTEEDMIKLSHYTNLQFLTKFDNISKGNKYEAFEQTQP